MRQGRHQEGLRGTQPSGYQVKFQIVLPEFLDQYFKKNWNMWIGNQFVVAQNISAHFIYKHLSQIFSYEIRKISLVG